MFHPPSLGWVTESGGSALWSLGDWCRNEGHYLSVDGQNITLVISHGSDLVDNCIYWRYLGHDLRVAVVYKKSTWQVGRGSSGGLETVAEVGRSKREARTRETCRGGWARTSRGADCKN